MMFHHIKLWSGVVLCVSDSLSCAQLSSLAALTTTANTTLDSSVQVDEEETEKILFLHNIYQKGLVII